MNGLDILVMSLLKSYFKVQMDFPKSTLLSGTIPVSQMLTILSCIPTIFLLALFISNSSSKYLTVTRAALCLHNNSWD